MLNVTNHAVCLIFKFSPINKLLSNHSIFKWYLKNLTCSFYCAQVHRGFVTTNKNSHTNKGWKPLFRDGHREEYSAIKTPVSIEDGTDAVHHNFLLNQLQDCNTVSDQIKKFCSTMSLTSEDTEKRKEFCRSLTELFKPYFPEFKVHLFGSSINGLGFKGCDADVSIQTIFDDMGYIPKVTQPPSLDEVIRGEVSADYVAHLPPRMLLRFVRRILRTSDISDKILFIKARCPLLRFYSSKYNLFCDFTCENYFSLRNTKLMRLMCRLDDRVGPLIKLIRYWGKYGGFVGDVDLFNSYAFSLLVVHFLQLRNPPVLPPIKEVIEKSEYVVHGDVDSDDLLELDLKKFNKSQNSQTLEELLKEYFFHFLTFDYLKVLVPLSSSVIPKDEFLSTVIKDDNDVFLFSTITVQDPFRLNFNVTEGAKDAACLRYVKGLIETCKVYQDESLWSPTAENWGITNLFYRTRPNEATHKEEKQKWQKSSSHTIKLPLKTDVSMVKTIFQECLLIDCEEIMPLNKDGMVPSLKLNCTAYSNTWIGRDLISVMCPPSLTNVLEREKWISTQISKNKSTGKKRFMFSCECYDSLCDNQLEMVLSFKKPEEYAYYLTVQILVIFLKEYFLLMHKKLCKV